MARHKYTEEQDQFLIDNVKGITLNELRRRFNEKFNLSLSEPAISNRKVKLNIQSGIVGGQFEKGHIPFNRDKKWDDYMSKEKQENCRKTTFKKGNVPGNHREVGSERINVEGYIEVKIAEPSKWDYKHRIVYEEAYGKIPKGCKIIFADSNKLNCNLDNLLLVTCSELARLNQNGLIKDNADLTKAGLNLTKLMNEMYKKGLAKTNKQEYQRKYQRERRRR